MFLLTEPSLFFNVVTAIAVPFRPQPTAGKKFLPYYSRDLLTVQLGSTRLEPSQNFVQLEEMNGRARRLKARYLACRRPASNCSVVKSDQRRQFFTPKVSNLFDDQFPIDALGNSKVNR